MVKVDSISHLDCFHHDFGSIADLHHPFDGVENTICGSACCQRGFFKHINCFRLFLSKLLLDHFLVYVEQLVKMIFIFFFYSFHVFIVALSEDSLKIEKIIRNWPLLLWAVFINDFFGFFFVPVAQMFDNFLPCLNEQLIFIPIEFCKVVFLSSGTENFKSLPHLLPLTFELALPLLPCFNDL